MTNGKSINYLKIKAKTILKDEIPNCEIDINAILKYVLNVDDVFLITHRDDILSESDILKFEKLVALRKSSMPLSYVLGKKEFMSLPFSVNSSTLIPRCDTEILVEELINIISKNCTVLDLCTGSGAIGISLCKYIKNCFATCVDVFDDTLSVAKKNAIDLKVDNKIDFVKCDVLKNLKDIDKKFDVVVSNPPYIPTKTILTLDKTVKDFEPKSALDGGLDGLMFYNAIVENIEFILKKDGILAFEIGFDQKEQVIKIMERKFYNIYSKCDLYGNDRIIVGKLR